MCEFSLSANAKLGESRYSFCPSLPTAVIPRLLHLTGRGHHLDRGQSSGLDRLCYHHTLTKPFISFGRAWQHWEDDSQWTITLKAGLLFPSGLPISSAHKLISVCLCSITDINPEGGVFLYIHLWLASSVCDNSGCPNHWVDGEKNGACDTNAEPDSRRWH